MLLLLPNLLDPHADPKRCFPPAVFEAAIGLKGLIAESEKGGRHFLRLVSPKTFRDTPIFLLNEHSKDEDLKALVKTIAQGGCFGLISDAGMPCLADPGASLVKEVRKAGVKVEILTGPSSIVIALALSGLSGQSFAFHGYLAREEATRSAQLKMLEKRSSQEKAAQIFIEAPYRNQKLFAHLLSVLQDKTLVCVASDLTGDTQEVTTLPIGMWKRQQPPRLDDRPTVFLLQNS